MITYKNLFTQIITFQNLNKACHEAARGKKDKYGVADFIVNKEKEILRLQNEMENGSYAPGGYHTFWIAEYAKKREISAAPFRDRVVHHAFCQIVEPIFDKRFVFHSFACRKDKGTHKALKVCQNYLRRNNFVFQGDIVKYFNNIDQDVLLGILRKKIKDDKTMRLAELIVFSWNKDIGKGVPIGNLTSQFFANLYLNELDYFVKFNLREHFYLRYMDDFLIFGVDKKNLQTRQLQVTEFISDKLKLALHQKKTLVYSCSLGVPWLGFRIFSNYRRLKRANILRFLQKIRILRKQSLRKGYGFEETIKAVNRWINHAESGDTYCLRKKLFHGIIFNK